MRPPKTISDFTDKELADMVRECLYARGARFAEDSSRFLLVLAVPYGKVDDVHSLPEAMEAFRDLLFDEDWTEREFQVYDHATGSRHGVAYEELEQETDEEDEDLPHRCAGCGREEADCSGNPCEAVIADREEDEDDA